MRGFLIGFLAVSFALFLFCVSGHGTYATVAPETIMVPRLHGPDLMVRASDAHKISPIGWSMILDRDERTKDRERSYTLFDEACKRRPELMDEVARLQAIRSMIRQKTVIRRARTTRIIFRHR